MIESCVMVVDENDAQRAMLVELLRGKVGYEAQQAACLKQAAENVFSGLQREPDVLLLSSPTDDSTLDFIARCRQVSPHLPIIVMIGYGESELAVRALEAGAVDFLSKPASHQRLKTSISNALRNSRLKKEIERLTHLRGGGVGLQSILGESAVMQRLRETLHTMAQTDLPLLLEGEKGCGLRLAAQAVHGSGPHAEQPFTVLDCADEDSLLQGAALFGGEPVFPQLPGGTFYLLEIGALDRRRQTALLRQLQMPSRHKAGYRIICSDSYGLTLRVREGGFREDLYDKLRVGEVRVPPLRERTEDIPLLAGHFCRQYGAQEDRFIREISPEAMAGLQQLAWPGNVRQLSRLVQRAVLLSDGERLTGMHFSPLLGINEFSDRARQRQAFLSARQLPLCTADGNLRSYHELEEDLIFFAVQYYSGRMSEIARRLGIGRSTLYRKINDMNIQLA